MSDPSRFHAIAGSLGRIARDHGRQIFYLTSDPHDVERIRIASAGYERAHREYNEVEVYRRQLSQIAELI